MTDKNVSPLLESAHEFLEESLRNFSDGKLNFAIVHAVTATELVLKERLARLHPALVFKDIDAKTSQKEQQTVSLAALPRRLANLGIPLNPTHDKLIVSIAQWRHQIVHHMPTFDASAAEKQLPQLLDFLAGFLRTELDTPLETFLPLHLYKDANQILSDWKVAIRAAQANAIKEGTVLPDRCPRCGAAGVICLDKYEVLQCHLCGGALYLLDQCNVCGRKEVVVSYAPTSGFNMCDECINAAGDDYLQSQIEIARGK